MKARFVNEFTQGTKVDSVFVVRSKEMHRARTGDSYLALELTDRSGSIPAVLFRPSQAAIDLPVRSVVSVEGVVTSFRGVRRITVDAMRPAESWDSVDLVASGNRASNELVGEFKALVGLVSNLALRGLLRAVFGDKGFFSRFCRCPGARDHHHAYLGGLIEHTVAVAGLSVSFAERYDGVDRDLLLTAALLHDVGRVDELDFETGIGCSDLGRLVGHVVLGAYRVRDAATRANTPPDIRVQVEHAILSHHGEPESEAPLHPSTLEALLLFHADDLDVNAVGFRELLAGPQRAEESWTGAKNRYGRPLYSPERPKGACADVNAEDSRCSRRLA